MESNRARRGSEGYLPIFDCSDLIVQSSKIIVVWR